MINTSMLPKHIHKVKFYPSADDFTQALLVTNIMSMYKLLHEKGFYSSYWQPTVYYRSAIIALKEPHKAQHKKYHVQAI